MLRKTKISRERDRDYHRKMRALGLVDKGKESAEYRKKYPEKRKAIEYCMIMLKKEKLKGRSVVYVEKIRSTDIIRIIMNL